jgi:hypothetical protein
VAQEKEEALLRRLAGQCNFHVSNLCYRPGTRYLSAAPREGVASGGGVALGVSSANGTSSSAPTTLKDGVHFTASMLWEKARKAYKRQRAMVQHATKATMPSAHPGPYFFRYNGVPNAGEREEVEGKEKSTKKSRSSASLLLGAGGEAFHHVVHLNSVTAQSYVNPRFSVPWKAHLDLITRLNPSMQLEGSLYSSYNAPQGPSQSSLTAGVFIEDLAIKTCDVPWSLIAHEFQQLDADDPEYSFNGDITTSPRHALGSARPRTYGGGGGGGGAGGGASCRDTKRRASDHDLSLSAEGGETGAAAAAAGSPRELHKVDSASYSDLLAPPYREVPFDLYAEVAAYKASDDDSDSDDDMSEKAVAARHETMLGKMRARLALIQQLKKEVKEMGASGGGFGPGGNRTGSTSPRGAPNNRRRGGGGRRGNVDNLRRRNRLSSGSIGGSPRSGEEAGADDSMMQDSSFGGEGASGQDQDTSFGGDEAEGEGEE